MTDQYARPNEPDQAQPWSSPQDETAALPPMAQPSPWASPEPTISDPTQFGSASGYTNPSFGEPQTHLPSAAPAPACGTQPQPYPTPGYPQPAPSYPATSFEQPPSDAAAFGSTFGTYEPAREPAGVVAPYQVGYPASYQPPYAAQLPDHPNAVPALILGIVGFFVGISAPIAWYLGAKGNGDIRRQPGRWRSSPMLTAGMVMGIIATVLMVLGFGFTVLLVLLALADA